MKIPVDSSDNCVHNLDMSKQSPSLVEQLQKQRGKVAELRHDLQIAVRDLQDIEARAELDRIEKQREKIADGKI